MSKKLNYLREELRHQQVLLDATNRAIEGSYPSESLVDLFVAQAERIEDRIDELKKAIKDASSKDKGKSSKGKKKYEKILSKSKGSA